MDVELAQLWLPIIASAVLVFIASSVIHMVFQVHKNDFKPLPNEAEVLAALRDLKVEPGEYMFPACSMKDLGTPATLEKFNTGPVGHMVVRPRGVLSMGKSLSQWFVFCLVVSLFIAYLGSLTIARGTDYLQVFRITGTVAVLVYSVTSVMDSIWKGQSWSTTLKFVVDGILYGLVTAGTFGWLWPQN